MAVRPVGRAMQARLGHTNAHQFPQWHISPVETRGGTIFGWSERETYAACEQPLHRRQRRMGKWSPPRRHSSCSGHESRTALCPGSVPWCMQREASGQSHTRPQEESYGKTFARKPEMKKNRALLIAGAVSALCLF